MSDLMVNSDRFIVILVVIYTQRRKKAAPFWVEATLVWNFN